MLRYYITSMTTLAALMHDHHPPAPRKLSLAQQGVGVRLGIALGLVVLVWVAIAPLVTG